jgi:Tc5 transposase DNA-binding domain
MDHPIKIVKRATRYTTTTSMATLQQENPLFREGRLLLSINAHKQGQFTSFRKATATYDVPSTTVGRRAKGTKLKRGSIASNRRLTLAQEESLKQWILLMDQRGMPPQNTTVRQMASLLAT